MNERLADLTPAERLEIAASDPRVQLMEKLYGDPDAKKAIQTHSKRIFPKASVLEVDLPAEVDAKLAERDKEIQGLKDEIAGIKTGGRRAAFRADLKGYAADHGWDPDAKELDEIETFMVENEYGVKAAPQAVRAWIETKEPAEPNFEPNDPAFAFGEDDGSDYLKKLRASGVGDDTSALTLAHATKLADKMNVFGKAGTVRRSPALAGR